MKKKVFAVLGVLLVLIVGVIVYFVLSDLNQEEKLKNELEEINRLVDSESINMKEINEKLERIVTDGDYAVVERAFKDYLKDNFDNVMEITSLLNDERITKLLTVENYKNDGKEFLETKSYILSTREQLRNCKDKYIEFFTEDKIMSYINDKGLDSYYIDLYKDEFVGDIENDDSDQIVEGAIDELILLLDRTELVINFLSSNQDDWQIENDHIVFSSNSLSNEYDSLLDQVVS